MGVQPYRGSNADIERIAESLREEVVDAAERKEIRGRELLERIVDVTGGAIKVVDDPCQQEVDGGSLIIRGDRDYTIFLSPYTTPLRDNFTIAHEIGHFILHFTLQSPKPTPEIGFTRYGRGPLEWQANRFGAALLLPAVEFREKHRQFRGDEFLLSGYFEVSRPAVVTRAESLNCR